MVSIIRFAMDRPRPVPSPTGLVVKNGEKILVEIFSGIPFPESRTENLWTCGASFLYFISIICFVLDLDSSYIEFSIRISNIFSKLLFEK